MNFKTKFNRRVNKLVKAFPKSFDDVVEAIQLQCTCGSEKHFLVNDDGTAIGRVNPPYNDIEDILMYFPDYTDMSLTHKYLEAYLTTNRDVLGQSDINELERLLKRFS
jgi:hypothetical protein